jgi:hypothetical protein
MPKQGRHLEILGRQRKCRTRKRHEMISPGGSPGKFDAVPSGNVAAIGYLTKGSVMIEFPAGAANV